MFKYFFPGLIFSWYIAVHILFFLQFGENEENRGYYFDYEGLNTKPIYFWRSFSYELGWMLTNDQSVIQRHFNFPSSRIAIWFLCHSIPIPTVDLSLFLFKDKYTSEIQFPIFCLIAKIDENEDNIVTVIPCDGFG